MLDFGWVWLLCSDCAWVFVALLVYFGFVCDVWLLAGFVVYLVVRVWFVVCLWVVWLGVRLFVVLVVLWCVFGLVV